MRNILSDLQPWLALLSAVLSLSVLGFVIRLALLMRDAAGERIKALEERRGIVEERLKMKDEELTRTEKWYEKEVAQLKEQLSSLLARHGAALDASMLNATSLPPLPAADSEQLATILERTRSLEDFPSTPPPPQQDPEWHLEIAKGYALAGDWISAARHYERYLQTDTTDWQAHFLCAVAFANSRNGGESDLAAVREYGAAIAYAPEGLPSRIRSRLYDYMGAMFKRLRRLDEAEAFLLLARRLAEKPYEAADIAYNLACVYAMSGRREEMMEVVRLLVREEHWRRILRSKKEYFERYWSDPEFTVLVHSQDDNHEGGLTPA